MLLFYYFIAFLFIYHQLSHILLFYYLFCHIELILLLKVVFNV